MVDTLTTDYVAVVLNAAVHQQFLMYRRVPHPNLFWAPFTLKRIPAGEG
jgi:hypothetical protein